MSHTDSNTKMKDLILKVRSFIRERDWEKYHNPKDLAESLCIEAVELLQLFQWMSSEESKRFKNNPSKVRRIKEELADVVIYCISMANTLDIDLTSIVIQKIEQNKEKYPADRYKGKAHLTA